MSDSGLKYTVPFLDLMILVKLSLFKPSEGVRIKFRIVKFDVISYNITYRNDKIPVCIFGHIVFS